MLGTWTKGRVVALSRLAKNAAEFDYLTAQDLQVCSYIKYDYYSGSQYSLSREAIRALASHPLVFWEESPTVRLEIIAATPELVVEQGGDGTLTLHMEPAITPGDGISLVKETPTRLKVLEVTDEHQKIADILGKRNQLTVPAQMASGSFLSGMTGPIRAPSSSHGSGSWPAAIAPIWVAATKSAPVLAR